VRRGVLLLLILFAACRPPGAKLEELRAGAYADLGRGSLDGALRRADEGLAQARSRGDRRWQWVFQVIRAEVLVQQRLDAKEAAASLDDGLRSEPRDAVYLRALMTSAYSRCVDSAARGHEEEALAAALPQLEEADRLAATLGPEEPLAEIALRRGNCRIAARRFAEAESSYREALSIARRNRLAFLESQAAGSLAMLRARQDRWDDATDWLRRALESVPRGASPSLRMKHLGNLGWFYLELGDYQRALPLLVEAEALAERTSSPGDRLYALTHLAEARQGLGDDQGARELLGRALTLARSQSNTNFTAELLRLLSLVTLDEGQHAAAHAHAREALRLNTETNNQSGRLAALLAEGRIHADEGSFVQAAEAFNAVLRQAGDRAEHEWEARARLAQLSFRSGQLKAATGQFQRAFALMERARADVRKADNRIAFFAGLRRFHESYVDLLVQQGRHEDALMAAEESRARLLQERLQVPRGAPRKESSLRERARAARAVILSFWVTRERTLLWVVTPAGVRLSVLPGERALAARVDAYQGAILNGRDPLTEHQDAGQWLYETLLAPAAASVPPGSRVVVVPDGPLFRLNLETLVVPGARPHYWIEDVTMILAPWAGSVASRSALPLKRDRDLLLIGDPLPANPDFPRLAHAAREMETIAWLFERTRVASYARLEAVPGAYRDAGPERFAFVHFAAHAAANEESPLDSAIVLSSRDDRYKLYAREIMAVPLRAELVSLSACRGAGSRAYAGEGLVGLAWSFLAAGARSVLAGIWDVEDASTAAVMEDIYRGMSLGRAPEDALREAKLRMLRSATVRRKPIYWAPFALYAGAG
jgi:CHAT domain-containing protein